MSYHYMAKVKVYPGDKSADIFDIKDNEFMAGSIRHRPPEFDLHLAIYILEREGMDFLRLELVKNWAKENTVAGSKYPLLFDPEYRVKQ